MLFSRYNGNRKSAREERRHESGHKNLPPEVAAYIRSLEQKNQQLEKQLVKLQSLNEQLVKMRKRMFGQSSEQIQYVDARQLDLFNEAEVCSDASAPEPGKRHR